MALRTFDIQTPKHGNTNYFDDNLGMNENGTAKRNGMGAPIKYLKNGCFTFDFQAAE
jgi:hypothetical protein